MKHLSVLATCLLSAVGSLAEEIPKETMPVREAMKLAGDYMQNLRPEMQILNIRAADGKSPLATRVINVPVRSSPSQMSPLHHVACIEGGTYIVLAFKHPPRPDSDLEELQMDLAGVWTPMVAVPEVKAKGWHVRVATVNDHNKINRTVLDSFENGVLRFRVTSNTLGLEGEMDPAEGVGREKVVDMGNGPEFVRTDSRELVVPDDKYFAIQKPYLFGFDIACRLIPEGSGDASPKAPDQKEPPPGE